MALGGSGTAKPNHNNNYSGRCKTWCKTFRSMRPKWLHVRALHTHCIHSHTDYHYGPPSLHWVNMKRATQFYLINPLTRYNLTPLLGPAGDLRWSTGSKVERSTGGADGRDTVLLSHMVHATKRQLQSIVPWLQYLQSHHHLSLESENWTAMGFQTSVIKDCFLPFLQIDFLVCRL
jgi:hypothetical protein